MIAPNVATLSVVGKGDDLVLLEARAHGVALKVGELRQIAQRLGRDPTIVEVHAFDAQWSEHCSYKSSRSFLSRLPSSGAAVVLGPGEDAGVVHLGEFEGERYGIVVAHESHNHPSQVVPFEGAATGIGGIRCALGRRTMHTAAMSRRASSTASRRTGTRSACRILRATSTFTRGFATTLS